MTDAYNGTGTHAQPVNVEKSKRKAKRWAALGAAFAAMIVLAVVLLAIGNVGQDDKIADNTTTITAQGDVITRQNAVIGQICQLAGGQVNTDPKAKDACARVSRGELAVPAAAPVTGIPGVGISYARQLDRCFVEVGLTSGSASRFGPFCGEQGAPGSTGPTGPSGATGDTGAPGSTGAAGVTGESGAPGVTGERGRDGVGIADVKPSADRCFIDITLTSGETRTLGPFCGPPMAGVIFQGPQIGTQSCTRAGGEDSNPTYSCTAVAPPDTSTPTVTETATTTEVATTTAAARRTTVTKTTG
jgi:hypothetical protein